MESETHTLHPVALLGVVEAKVSLEAAFRSSALLPLITLIFLLTKLHRISMGFRLVHFVDLATVIKELLGFLVVS